MQRFFGLLQQREKHAPPVLPLIGGAAALTIVLLLLIVHQYRVATTAFAESRMADIRTRVESLSVTQSALAAARFQQLGDGLSAVGRLLLHAQTPELQTVLPMPLLALKRYNPVIDHVLVVEQEGRVLYHTGLEQLPNSDLQGLLERHRRTDSQEVLLSGPYHRDPQPSGAGSTGYISLSVPVYGQVHGPDTEHELQALALAIISLDALAAELGSATLWPGVSVALITRSREVLFRVPQAEDAPRQLPPSAGDYTGTLPIERTFADISPFDGESRMVSVRTLPVEPLIIVVTEQLQPTLNAIHRYTRAEAARWSAVGAVVLLLTLLVAYSTVRHVRAARLLAAGNRESMRIQAELAESEEQFRAIFETSMTAIMIHDIEDGSLIEANQRAIESYGCSTLAELQNKGLFDEPPYSYDDARARILSTRSSGPQRFEWRSRRTDDSVFWEDVFVQTITLKGVERVIAVAVDITERKRAEEQIRHMAQHDPLTGLPNRYLFADRVQQAVTLADRTGVSPALLYIDLDRFKPINDELGHEAGDHLLIEVARRISSAIRTSDSAGRIGGDEFNVLLTVVENRAAAVAVAEKIGQELRRPIIYRNGSFEITASIGVAMYPQDAGNQAELIRAADAAMYTAKQRGRDQVCSAATSPP